MSGPPTHGLDTHADGPEVRPEADRDLWTAGAPLRISLAGGGTDLPSYAHRFGGAVLAAAVDLRVTVTARRGVRPGVRACLDVCGHARAADDLANPFARELVRRHWKGGALELVSEGDVPPGTGLGSSAAFCVALLAGLRGRMDDRVGLAEEASAVEHVALGRPVGRQDHYLSALGGFRLLHFARHGGVEVEDVEVPEEVSGRLAGELLLFASGVSRDAGKVLSDQHQRVVGGNEDTRNRLHEIKALVPAAVSALRRGDGPALGEVLARHWALKRGLGDGVSLRLVDLAYRDAVEAGATGGKLLGAGGGGFMLVHARPEVRDPVCAALSAHGFTRQHFAFSRTGVEVGPAVGRPRPHTHRSAPG